MSLAAAPGAISARGALAALSLAAAGASLLVCAVAVWGAKSGRLGWSLAVDTLLGAATPALAAVAVAAGAVAALLAVLATPRGGSAAPAIAALLGAMVLLGLGAWRAQAARVALVAPPVHDVATDWRDPLMPTAALVRRRGPDALPIEAAPALSEGPRAGFLGRLVAEVNATTCPRATPLVTPQPPAAAYARLKAAALAGGLRLVTDDPAAGVLEAEASAPLAWGAMADVIARVRRDGEGARIDLRSISRHGRVDGGTNCRRLFALREAVARR